jgi:hypothetical protein
MRIDVQTHGETVDASVAFMAPDTWELKGPGTLEYPEHVIVAGDRGWEQTGSTWRDFPRVKAMRETLVSFVSTVDSFQSDQHSSGKGPRYGGEKTFRFVRTRPMQQGPIPDVINGHPIPPDLVATLTALYEDATVKTEMHVGADSKLIYFMRSLTDGPHSDVDLSWTFDYSTPVSITLPS